MKQHETAEPIIDDLTPPPRFPLTFQQANLTIRCLAGVALYIGCLVEGLNKLPENSTEWDWDALRYDAAEAECCMAEALQRLARSERSSGWYRRQKTAVQP